VAALAHAHDLPVSPVGTTPVGLLHAATSVPNHIASELQDLVQPAGLRLDLTVEDGAFVLGDRPGLGVTVDRAEIDAVDRRDGVGPTGPHVRPVRAGQRLVPDTLP